MQNINKLFLGIAAMLVVAGIGVTTQAHANENYDDNTSYDKKKEYSQEYKEYLAKKKAEAERLQKEAQEKLEAKQAQARAKKQEIREKSCDARKSSLTKRMGNAVTHAERHKAVFDKIYTRVKEFHDEKNLNTPNYEALVTQVDTAQSEATERIAALKTLEFTIDCTKSSVGENVKSFRAAVKSARDALKDYRKAIVNLIVAAHDSNNSTNEGAE